jgi:hypothetical protein
MRLSRRWRRGRAARHDRNQNGNQKQTLHCDGNCHKTGSQCCRTDSPDPLPRVPSVRPNPHWRKVRQILSVDDDPAIRRVVADILEMSSYAVREAANGLRLVARSLTQS